MTYTRRWWHARYELRMVRSDAPHVTVLVRSRHRFRALAELSRRGDRAHMALVPGCELIVVDGRKDDGDRSRVATLSAPAAATSAPAAATTPQRFVA